MQRRFEYAAVHDEISNVLDSVLDLGGLTVNFDRAEQAKDLHFRVSGCCDRSEDCFAEAEVAKHQALENADQNLHVQTASPQLIDQIDVFANHWLDMFPLQLWI